MTQIGADAATEDVAARSDAEDALTAPAEAVESDNSHNNKKKPSTARSIVEWILVLGGALIVALLIRNFLFTTFWIPSESMQPTLVGDSHHSSGRHDRVVVNRLSYKLHDVRRGDIVVFTTPPSESPVTEGGRKINDLIKRVVGLPGETVTLRDSHVYIDNRLLSEPYLPKGTQTVPICQQESVFKVPAGSVLVMGDNRSNSQDGRCFGPIQKKTIVGRAFVRIWPIPKFTWL